MRYALRSVFSLLISYCIMAPLMVILNYGIKMSVVASFLLFIHVFLVMILFNMKVFKWFAILAGSALAVFILFMLLFKDGSVLPPSITDYIKELYAIVISNGNLPAEMFVPTLFIVCLGISLPVYILIQKLKADTYIYLIGVVFFVFIIIEKYKFKPIYFILFVFICLVMYFEKYFSAKLESKKISKGLLIILPSLLVFAFILTSASFLLSSKESDPAGFLDDITDMIKSINFNVNLSGSDRIVTYRTDMSYPRNLSSFDTTVVLTVDSPKRFHLRSQVFDTYNGNGWILSENLSKNVVNVDSGALYGKGSLEVAENVFGYYSLKNGRMPDIGNLTNEDFYNMAGELFDTVELKITYVNIHTKAIFAPADTFYIRYGGGNTFLLDTLSGILSSKNNLSKNATYRLQVLVPKTGTKEFVDLLRSGNTKDLLSEAYINRNLDNYLQVPETMPSRVRELAVSITEGYDNDYDKARAIEKYLALNYKYSLNIENTPWGMDFVDYFLFEEKTGFCTYYASAMVMMLRTIGIPARYAIGYVMPGRTAADELFEGTGQPSGNTLYTVTEKNAHAWPEAYMKGYGWLSFEPTVTYYQDFSGQGQTEELYGPDEEPVLPVDDGVITPPIIDNDRIAADLRSIFVIFALLLIIFPFVYRIIKKAKYSRYSNRKKVIYIFKRIIDLMKLSGCSMEPSETARSYAQKIDARLYHGDNKFEKAVSIFEEARYSGNQISIFHTCEIKKYYIAFKKEILAKTNRFRKAAYNFNNIL